MSHQTEKNYNVSRRGPSSKVHYIAAVSMNASVSSLPLIIIKIRMVAWELGGGL